MAVLSRDFPLDPTILGQGSAAHLAVTSAANAATLAALTTNAPFPAAGELGHVSLGAGTGQGVRFAAGDAAVTFKGATSVDSTVAIFEAPRDALKSVGVETAEGIALSLPSWRGSRWAVMRWHYDVSGALSAAHPLGAIGSATLGVDAKWQAAYAVLHAFEATTGAQDVLTATIGSWRLPRHVSVDADDVNIRPRTWIVAEADGSLALNVAARLGYDVRFTHESSLLGITRDLGAKIDANLKATLGVNVAGRYVIVVGRESLDPASRVVRLRLFKESRGGVAFGLNLNVGVTGDPPLPDRFDDFVRTVFGVHGPQVLRDLRVIEEWTDPSKDLADTAARLVSRTGLDLLHRATGLDVREQFHEARRLVVEALDRWNGLPDRVSSMLWGYLSRTSPEDVMHALRKFLTALAGPDLESRRAALAAALAEAPVSDNAITAWLEAVAERGLLAMADDLDRVSGIAGQTLAILDGGVVQKIGQFVSEKLDLEPLRQAVADDDFSAIEGWLNKRLADLLNKPELHLDDLKQVQRAIAAVDAKVRDLYETGLSALTKRYSADLASTYARNHGETALVDVSFDLGVADALARFRSVAEAGALDDLLLRPAPGVTLNRGTLTHGIGQRADIDVRLPFVTAESSHVTDALAKLSVEEHAGRVLMYEFDATDTITTANRARSELSVLGSLTFPGAGAGAAGRSAATGTIAYESRHVQRAMRRADLEARTHPFLDAYLAPLFPAPDVSISAFFDTVAGARPGDGAVLGDVAISTELSYPAQVLEGWLRPRDEDAVRRDSMYLSRAIQASIKRLLARTYFEDLDHLQVAEPVAALLVWSSIPVSTSIDVQGAAIRFNSDRQVFWNYVSEEERRAIAAESHTVRALQASLSALQVRLRAEGRRDVDRFDPRQAGRFVQLALERGGDLYLTSLLTAEALMIGGAVRALKTIARAIRDSRTAPSAALRALAEFAGTLAETFNGELNFVYTKEAVRTLGPMMLAEASAAIHPEFQATVPRAALRLYVLKGGHDFKLDRFLKGDLPSSDNVAIAETLVRA